MERRYGGCLCYGPPIESGFYYDSYMGEESVCEADYTGLESIMKSITKEKQPFQRLVMTKVGKGIYRGLVGKGILNIEG